MLFEFKVTFDNLLTFAGLVLTSVGLLFVAWQIRDANKQSKLDSQVRLYDINRELISLGFSKPELFEVLKDGGKPDPSFERWYLQLWLNLLSLFHSLKIAGVLEQDYEDSVDHELRDMFSMANMRHHWKEFGKYYPASFQRAVNDVLHEAGHELNTPSSGKTKRSRPAGRFARKRREAS